MVARPEPPQRVQVLFGEDATRWLALSPIEKASYWSGFVAHDPSLLVRNYHARTGIVVFEGDAYPITLTDRPVGNAYPCSLHAQYVSYPLAELSLVKSGLLRTVARLGLRSLQLPLLAAEVDRTVQWNSWLLSTNLVAESLVQAVGAVTKELTQRFPSHAVLLKNINLGQHPALIKILAEHGYDLITSRVVYLFDGREPHFLQKSTFKRDHKSLCQQRDYTFLEHEDFSVADVPRVTELYRQLYLEKHSYLNPQYTERFVSHALSERWLQLRGLRHRSGRIDAVLGCFQRETVTSTPFVGYDTQLPLETGLYRMLVTMLLTRVAEEKTVLNYSSGAGEFKRRRGGEPAVEFNAVYSAHLPPRRRAGFAVLRELVNRFGRRFLEENRI
jgi:hypothetical protein